MIIEYATFGSLPSKHSLSQISRNGTASRIAFRVLSSSMGIARRLKTATKREGRVEASLCHILVEVGVWCRRTFMLKRMKSGLGPISHPSSRHSSLYSRGPCFGRSQHILVFDRAIWTIAYRSLLYLELATAVEQKPLLWDIILGCFVMIQGDPLPLPVLCSAFVTSSSDYHQNFKLLFSDGGYSYTVCTRVYTVHNPKYFCFRNDNNVKSRQGTLIPNWSSWEISS